MRFDGDIEVRLTGDGADVNGRTLSFLVERAADGAILLTLGDGRIVRAFAAGDQVHVGGRAWDVKPLDERRQRRGGDRDDQDLVAPMPGVVLQVRVAAGDAVEAGQILMVVEAMKMEQSVKAPRDGRVARVCFAEGDRVGPGDPLVELE